MKFTKCRKVLSEGKEGQELVWDVLATEAKGTGDLRWGVQGKEGGVATNPLLSMPAWKKNKQNIPEGLNWKPACWTRVRTLGETSAGEESAQSPQK